MQFQSQDTGGANARYSIYGLIMTKEDNKRVHYNLYILSI